jgi:hypothetical protein
MDPSKTDDQETMDVDASEIVVKVQKLPKTVPKKSANKKSKSAVIKKASKATKKVTKSAHESTAQLVANALTKLKKRGGISMSAIYKHIAAETESENTKQRRNLVKRFMTKEFSEGRIVMVNDDGDEIKFNKRFNISAVK